MKTKKVNYEKQADDFAKKHGITMKILSSRIGSHFIGEKEKRWIFKIQLKRNKKQFTFNFGQTIASGEKNPTMYDILSSLQKYDVQTLDEFCREFGYDMYEPKSKKVHHLVSKEFRNVERLFADILFEMQEIH